jgi:hypothetical protein
VLGVRADGPGLMLADTAENPRAVLSVVQSGENGETSAAAVALFDKDGKVIWQAP